MSSIGKRTELDAARDATDPTHESPSHTRRWLGLIAISLGVALIVVDTTIVNVIAPSLVENLGVSSGQVQWVQESYPIVLAALLLVTGRLADLFGARRVFLAGVAGFAATSALAGIAPGGGVLVIARFLQGAAAAAIMPSSLSLVNTTFTGKQRGRAFAVWGATTGFAAALGPLLGGALAELSWRWAFGVNVPLGVLVVLGTWAFLTPTARTGGSVDLVGAVPSVVGFGLLAFTLIESRTYGWITSTRSVDLFGLSCARGGPSPVLIALVVAVVTLLGFVWWQGRLSSRGEREPLMNLRLFAIRSFRYGIVAILIIGLGEFGIVAVLPLWLQFALGYSSLQAGLALVPLAAGTFAASTASLPVTPRFSARGLVRLGLLLEIAGLVGLGLIATPDSAWWPIALTLFLFGVGAGFATAQIANVILAEVPGPSAGRGAAIQSTAAQLGSALGIAVLTTVFFSFLSVTLHQRLLAGGVPGAQADQLTGTVTNSAGAAIGPLTVDPRTGPLAEVARAAMTDSLSVVGYLAAGLLVLGVLATTCIPRSAAE